MRRIMWAALGALLALPMAAGAQVDVSERAQGDTEVFGLPIDSLSAAVGYGNWTGEGAEDIAPGTGFGVNMDLDASRAVDVLVGYQGNVISITASGLNEFNLYNNQIAAGAQVQPFSVANVEPYVAGSIGLARASVAKNPDLNVDFQSDTMGVIPLAAGAQYDLTDNIVIGAQAQWDVLFDNEILTQEATTNADRWGIMLNVGAANF